MRTCIVCRNKDMRENLTRLVMHIHNNSANVILDINKCLEGRGAWVHRTKSCFSKVKTKCFLKKAFKTYIDINMEELTLKNIYEGAS